MFLICATHCLKLYNMLQPQDLKNQSCYQLQWILVHESTNPASMGVGPFLNVYEKVYQPHTLSQKSHKNVPSTCFITHFIVFLSFVPGVGEKRELLLRIKQCKQIITGEFSLSPGCPSVFSYITYLIMTLASDFILSIFSPLSFSSSLDSLFLSIFHFFAKQVTCFKKYD